MRRRIREIHYRVGVCAGVGALGATVLSLFVLGLFLVRGSDAFRENHTSLLAVIITYYIGLSLGGAIVGLLLPFTGTRVGKAAVGSLCAACFYGSIVVSLDGFALGVSDLFLIIGTSLVGGSILGLKFHSLLSGK